MMSVEYWMFDVLSVSHNSSTWFLTSHSVSSCTFFTSWSTSFTFYFTNFVGPKVVQVFLQHQLVTSLDIYSAVFIDGVVVLGKSLQGGFVPLVFYYVVSHLLLSFFFQVEWSLENYFLDLCVKKCILFISSVVFARSFKFFPKNWV